MTRFLPSLETLLVILVKTLRLQVVVVAVVVIAAQHKPPAIVVGHSALEDEWQYDGQQLHEDPIWALQQHTAILRFLGQPYGIDETHF